MNESGSVFLFVHYRLVYWQVAIWRKICWERWSFPSWTRGNCFWSLRILKITGYGKSVCNTKNVPNLSTLFRNGEAFFHTHNKIMALYGVDEFRLLDFILNFWMNIQQPTIMKIARGGFPGEMLAQMFLHLHVGPPELILTWLWLSWIPIPSVNSGVFLNQHRFFLICFFQAGWFLLPCWNLGICRTCFHVNGLIPAISGFFGGPVVVFVLNVVGTHAKHRETCMTFFCF